MQDRHVSGELHQLRLQECIPPPPPPRTLHQERPPHAHPKQRLRRELAGVGVKWMRHGSRDTGGAEVDAEARHKVVRIIGAIRHAQSRSVVGDVGRDQGGPVLGGGDQGHLQVGQSRGRSCRRRPEVVCLCVLWCSWGWGERWSAGFKQAASCGVTQPPQTAP